MHRYIFYFSVALLAFGIGWLISFEIFWKDSPEIAAEITSIEIKSSEQTADSKIHPVEFTCENKAVNTVWKMLMRNKTFLNDAYINVVQSRQIKDCRELFDVKPIKLNDNNDGFIVIGNHLAFCDSGGNCQTWIVSRMKKHYEIVFYSTTGDSTVDSHPRKIIKSLSAKTHDYNDLKVFIPNGWEADNIAYFKFDGNKYRLKKCLKDFNSAYVYQNDYVEKWLNVKSNECLKDNWL